MSTSHAPTTDQTPAPAGGLADGWPARLGRTRGELWHGGMALGCALLAAVLLIAFEAQAQAAALGLGALALAGLAGSRAGAAEGRRRTGLMVAWAFAAALAAGLTGGVSGPFAVMALTPVLAGAVLGGFWLDGVALGLAVLVPTALAQWRGLTLGPAGSPVDPWLFVCGLAGLVAAAALALRPAAAATPVAGVAQEADPTLAHRLAAAEAARAEAERGRAVAEAQALSRARFLANMSHELRTPLNAIIGFSDIMKTRLFGPIPDKYGEYAGLIHESGGHLLDLINDVLDISKIEADRYDLHREALDAREAVQAALRLVRVQADEAGIQLRGVLPGEPLEALLDRRAVKQIVLNLVSNALKFTPRGGSVTVTAGALAGEAGGVSLTVSDTGVGIAQEDLTRLGRPFEQAGEGRTQGTGLGLSLVKALAGLHGGTMVVESRLGEGTAVTVTLPGATVDPDPGSR